MMKIGRHQGLALAALLAVSCGGSSPVTPVAVVPTPAPTPVPTPAPTPSPTPTPVAEICDDCEVAVTNRNSPVRLTLRLYTLEDGFGQFVRNPSPLDVIKVGWFARLDVVAKDIAGDETNGNEEVVWHFSDESLIRVTGNHTHQRRVKALAPGYVDVWATQEGVRSNTLTLTFGN
jgi:hypothetical protein